MTAAFANPVLIVDDDREFAAEIRDYLARFHIPVRLAETPGAAEAVLREGPVSMLLLDVMLPEKHGFDLCRDWRTRMPGLPIIFVSAYCDSFEQVLGFEAGADQFLRKPFAPQELLARMKALARRVALQGAPLQPAAQPPIFQPPAEILRTRAGLVADLRRGTVSLQGMPLVLTPFQFELLAYFLRHPGRLLTRDDIMTEVQSYARPLEGRSVDINVSRLRRALGDAAETPRFIRTVWRRGYVFIDEVL